VDLIVVKNSKEYVVGLDMYLKGRRYLRSYVDEDRDLIGAVEGNFPELESLRNLNRGSLIKIVEIEAAYWRKANHIHGWFVRKVQDDKDDCGCYPVNREQLTELKELCERVLGFRHLANELLPRQQGFFFGDSENYGEDYYQDIEYTIEACQAALNLPDIWDFEYHSSW
jgi:hypothetical protein